MRAPPDRCEVIYAAAPDRAAPVVDALQRLDPGPGLTVLYVSQISAEKGVGLLVEAVEAVEALVTRYNVRFVIAGDYSCRNSFGEGLVELVSRRGLSDRIIFRLRLGHRRAVCERGPARRSSMWEEPYGLTVAEAKSRRPASIVFPS